MKKNSSQILNTLVIIVGAAVLIYGMSVEDNSPYAKIIGLVILMFGLYRATQYWSATKDDYKRSMPGRIIGVTIDQEKKQTYRMALQTREQHIRRDKATSNICTSQALLANVSAAFAVYHGPEGLKLIANNIHEKTKVLALGFSEKFKIYSNKFFDTILIHTNNQANRYYFKALNESINLRQIDKDLIGISLDETTRKKDIVKLWSVFGLNLKYQDIYKKLKLKNNLGIIIKKRRTTSFLDHPIFHKYRSETEMMRYLKKLSDKDIALNRAMIPLGSCTMKLNAATELIPIAYRGFARIHPFVPSYQVKGYLKLIEDLNKMLSLITGFDEISFQPNSGAQGEYAGLMTIKAYLDDIGQSNRDICLIPSSAHGTNPASAIMAGMKVVVIDCDKSGNVDIKDLLKKVIKKGKNGKSSIFFESRLGSIRGTKDYLKYDLTADAIFEPGFSQEYRMVDLAQPAKLGQDRERHLEP